MNVIIRQIILCLLYSLSDDARQHGIQSGNGDAHLGRAFRAFLRSLQYSILPVQEMQQTGTGQSQQHHDHRHTEHGNEAVHLRHAFIQLLAAHLAVLFAQQTLQYVIHR